MPKWAIYCPAVRGQPESAYDSEAGFREQALLLAEFGEIADDLRLAAAAAAVAGDPFDMACGATIAQFPEAQFTAMIGELAGIRIVQPGTRSGSFSFCATQ